MKAIKQLKGLGGKLFFVAVTLLQFPQAVLPSPPDDTTPPVITCPQNISIMVSGPQVVNYALPVVYDEQGESIEPQLTEGLAPGSVFPLGITTNKYTATDEAGNSSECSFTVTLIPFMTGVLDYDGSVSKSIAPQAGIHVQRSFYLLKQEELEETELSAGSQIHSIGFMYGIVQPNSINGNLKVWLKNTTDTISRIDTAYTYVSLNDTTLALTGLDPGDYEWQVRSVCSDTARWSELKYFLTPDLSECNKPYNLKETDLTSTSVTLNWEAATQPGIGSFLLEYNKVGESQWHAEDNLTQTSFSLPGLIAEKTYLWRVTSKCGTEDSQMASSSFVVPLPESCNAPVNAQSQQLNDSTVYFHWNSDVNAEMYYLLYKRKGTSSWIKLITFSDNITVNKFARGTDYQWMVQSRCSAGVGSSPVYEFSTGGTPMCYAPVELKESNLSNTSAVLSWPVTYPAESYMVRYRLKNSIRWQNAQSDMQEVFNGPVSLPVENGRFDVYFNTSTFDYDGNGLYVALEYSNTGEISSTMNAALSSKENTSVKGSDGVDSVNYILSFDGRTDNLSTELPVVLKADYFRPLTFFGATTLSDNVQVEGLYTMGCIALPYTNEVPVKALVHNLSPDEAEYPVSLTVYDNTGIVRYSATSTITLSSMAKGYVTFNAYWPDRITTDSLVVSVPLQDNEVIGTNNQMYLLQNANMSNISWADNTFPLTGAGTGDAGGMLLVKHSMKGCGNIEKAMVYLYPSATGESLTAVILDSGGNLIDQSAGYTPDTTAIFSYHAFTFPQAPLVRNADYYIGIRLEPGSNATPVGVQWDGTSPRSDTYFQAPYDGSTISGLSPVGRLMIKAVIKPSMPVPYISGSPVICTGGSNTLQVASKTSRFATGVILSDTNNTTGPQILSDPDTYPAYNGSKSWVNNYNPDPSYRDKIIVDFADPLHANFIDIYETNNPGAIDSVFINSSSSGWVQVYSGQANLLPPVARINHISFPETDYDVTQVKISVHSGKFGMNHAIDAVAIGQEYDPATYHLYEWSSGETDQSITASLPGKYVVTVKNSEGCSISDSIVLAIPPDITPPEISWRGPLEFCAGDTTVILSCDKTGGLTWSNGETTDSTEVSATGNYTVTYNDGCNTAISQSVTITVNPLPEPTTTGGGICNGVPATLTCLEEFSSYEWSTEPVQNTQSVTVAEPDTYYLTVTDEKGCVKKVAVNTFTAPSPNPRITGEAGFCPGGSTVLDAGPGFNSYNWSTGSASQQAGVNTPGNVSVTVTNSYGCTGTDEIMITQFPVPSPVIGGTTSLCQGNTTQLDAGGGYSSYLWSTGGKSRYITVDTAGVFTVTVKDPNGCTGSSSIETNMDGALPGIPGPITGPVKGICNMQAIQYSIAPMDNTSHYVWTVPGGMEIASGQGSNVITLNAGTTGGWLSVAASNTCGQSATWNGRRVWLDCTPATPGPITGPASSVCGLSLVSYYINDVFGATYYDWTAPPGASIANGDGSQWVTVAFSNSFTSGNLSVTAQNSCGTSTSQTLLITGAPPQPGVITGPVTVCRKEKNVAYSITPLTNVSNYIWTVPLQAAIISGQGTPSVVVNFGNNSGNITVKPVNNCGNGLITTKAVNVQTCKSGEPTIVNLDPSAYDNPGWNYAWGQQVFQPEVFASAGDYSIGSTATMSWTIGEPVSGTITDNLSMLNQGFQQGAYTLTTANNISGNIIIEAFPVPAKEYVNIRIRAVEQPNLLIQLYDVLGNEVFRDVSESTLYDRYVSVAKYPTGIMLLNVTDINNHGHHTFRIVKL